MRVSNLFMLFLLCYWPQTSEARKTCRFNKNTSISIGTVVKKFNKICGVELQCIEVNSKAELKLFFVDSQNKQAVKNTKKGNHKSNQSKIFLSASEGKKNKTNGKQYNSKNKLKKPRRQKKSNNQNESNTKLEKRSIKFEHKEQNNSIQNIRKSRSKNSRRKLRNSKESVSLKANKNVCKFNKLKMRAGEEILDEAFCLKLKCVRKKKMSFLRYKNISGCTCTKVTTTSSTAVTSSPTSSVIVTTTTITPTVTSFVTVTVTQPIATITITPTVTSFTTVAQLITTITQTTTTLIGSLNTETSITTVTMSPTTTSAVPTNTVNYSTTITTDPFTTTVLSTETATVLSTVIESTEPPANTIMVTETSLSTSTTYASTVPTTTTVLATTTSIGTTTDILTSTATSIPSTTTTTTSPLTNTETETTTSTVSTTTLTSTTSSIVTSTTTTASMVTETQTSTVPTTTTTSTTVTTTTTTTAVVCNYSQFDSNHSGCLKNNYSYTSTSQKPDQGEIDALVLAFSAIRSGVASGTFVPGWPSAANMYEMKWSNELAYVAQQWADTASTTSDCDNCRKVFAIPDDIGQIHKAYGSSDNNSDWSGYTNDAIAQIPNFSIASVASYTSNTATDLITQFIWAKTYLFGCGKLHISSCTLNSQSYSYCKYYVCNFGPKGNVSGEPIYISGTAQSQCPNGPSTSTFPGLCATP